VHAAKIIALPIFAAKEKQDVTTQLDPAEHGIGKRAAGAEEF
jgi:hypothetical protein